MKRSVPRFNLCGVTRLLVPAYFAAIGVSLLTGSDALGLVAAIATAATIALVQRARGTTVTCALPAAHPARRPATEPATEPAQTAETGDPARPAQAAPRAADPVATRR